MSAESVDGAHDSAAAPASIERGAYEILRDRLLEHGRQLEGLTKALNDQRVALFGGQEMTVVGNERIRTENNCVPVDIVAVGGLLLFGYNVFIGLKSETQVADVFSLHRLHDRDGGVFEIETVDAADDANFLRNDAFVRDFKELYRYYKDSRLLHLRATTGAILAVFQVGAQLTDIRVFRWMVDAAGNVTYRDNRGERDYVFPPSHDFEWTVTTRASHVTGRHPHVSIEDIVFVETVGGDLTVKVENNTEDGQGIYREPVEDAHQSLADAQVHYARLGTLVLLKMLPYREKQWRYLIYNSRTREVLRVDGIGLSCMQLPEDHGVIFPGGYYLRSGAYRAFDTVIDGMQFVERIASPNGEDALYVYYRRDHGSYLLLPYNLIRKAVANPISANGYCTLDDGGMVLFRETSDEPTRVHAMQIWATPFASEEHFARKESTGSFLEKIGNPELVRGVADAFSICRRIDSQQPTIANYEDLIGATNRALDAYHWLGRAEVGDFTRVLKDVRTAAELVLDEFEKVQTLQKQASQAVSEASNRLADLRHVIALQEARSVDAFVDLLTRLRTLRGQIITLREMRYADLAALQRLEDEIVVQVSGVSAGTVTFLQDDTAFRPYQDALASVGDRLDACKKTSEVEPLRESIDKIAVGLEVLTEVIGGLQFDDPTVRTSILGRISELLSSLNRVRALVVARRKEMLGGEMVAEFAVQFQLYSQSVSGAVAMADTPEKCDQQLSRLLVGLEELEGKFSEFDEFLARLTEKRQEVLDAFSAKKQLLLEARQRRMQNICGAAERILEGVGRRTFESTDALNAYFAADPMIAKVRDLAEQLRLLGDAVKADEILARVKSARQDAVRALRDRTDMYEGGAAVIRLGRHRFSVNTQPLDLAMVARDGRMALHLSGTDFYETLEDEAFAATRHFWEQHMVSETAAVYRAEYLAACMLADAEQEKTGLTVADLLQAAQPAAGAPAGEPPPALLAYVRKYAETRYDEGYQRGLHDADAALVLAALVRLYTAAGLLRFAPRPRAMAVLFWGRGKHDGRRDGWVRRSVSMGRMRDALGWHSSISELAIEMGEAIAAFAHDQRLPLHPEEARAAGTYLFEELADGVDFVVSDEAVALADALRAWIDDQHMTATWQADLTALHDDLPHQHQLVSAWLDAFVRRQAHEANRFVLEETVALMLTDRLVERRPVERPRGEPLHLATVVEGVLGQHPRIEGRRLPLRLDEFLGRLSAFRLERVPAYQAFAKRRQEVLERERKRLRIAEFMPRVMSSFVRNKLINDVYLPLIGDNLAKQIGATGEGKRTDLMGMLLLVSPPGYGKTTLMEYVANRLGLVFMKINGPALGHGVTSLDPAQAPNATARQEIEKVNLAFEMGNNVMLYIDDIQHTNAEFLEKFISLCDAQRKIEGVWKGQVRTYDLRGKKFCVCMAGNPYTESGQKFKIPDMLANRADTYNLGDVLAGQADSFSLSYIENALTSNAALAPLAAREPGDVYKLVDMARGVEIPPDQLSQPYSGVELTEIVAVLRKLLVVRDLVLAVNAEYIRSAAQDDAFRTEPGFKLQGSYRNMNKIAEKIAAVMNDGELQRVLDDHYASEAQTLTTGAEHNLLKLSHLRGRLTDEETDRWNDIKRTFQRRQMLGGAEEDPVSRVTAVLGNVSQRLEDIGTAISATACTTAQAGADGLQALGRAAIEGVRETGRVQVALVAIDETLRALREAPPAVPPALVEKLSEMAAAPPAIPEALLDRLARLAEARPAIPDELLERLARVAEARPAVSDELLGRLAQLAESRTLVPEALLERLALAVESNAQTHPQAAASISMHMAPPMGGMPSQSPSAENVVRPLKALYRKMRGEGSKVIIMDRSVVEFLDALEVAVTWDELLKALGTLAGEGRE